MMKTKAQSALTAGYLALGLALSSQVIAAFTAEDAAEVNAEAKATLDQFKAETTGADEVLATPRASWCARKSSGRAWAWGRSTANVS